MKINYQNKIVAFLDVLGFKNLIYSDSTKSINSYYDFVLSNFDKAVKEKSIDYLLISDSIVIYSKQNVKDFEILLKTINVPQAGLLAKGILLWGAISYGQLYVNKSKNVIVGTGLINAYKLELKAKYPRVIIDRSIVKLFYLKSAR